MFMHRLPIFNTRPVLSVSAFVVLFTAGGCSAGSVGPSEALLPPAAATDGATPAGDTWAAPPEDAAPAADAARAGADGAGGGRDDQRPGPIDGGGSGGADGAPTDAHDEKAPLDAPIPEDAAPFDAPAVPPCPADAGVPTELRCTGLYADWDTKAIASDVHYYDPGFRLWSDGATKRRWIRLPPNMSIDTSNMDEWSFPVGTKVWKEFSLGGQLSAGGQLTGNGKIVETRLLWKQSAGQWTYLLYRWSDDQMSTRLLTTGDTVPQPDGPPAYEVPTTAVCAECHGGRQDVVLGFDLVGLGVPSAGATGGLTLATLPRQWLTQWPPSMRVAVPEDATGKAALALGFLHMNCGVTCHNASPRSKAVSTGFYAKLLAAQLFPPTGAPKATATDAYATAVNIPSRFMAGKYMRILPGNAAQSLVPLFALARAPNAGTLLPMPPILSHRADTDPASGVPVVQAWINAL
jgi:hypothetical protein